MPSPFPGMDPYLENSAFWSGFHTTFLTYLRAELAEQLPTGYYSEIEQHVWLQKDDDSDERSPLGYPDAYVAESSEGGIATAARTSSRPTTEVTMAKPSKRTHRFVKIVDQPGNRVITVIELLSPSNKDSGADRRSYLQKRAEYLSSGTNLVEIDLLRDGQRPPFGRPRPPQADYYALVSRAHRFPKASVWAFTVRDSLPDLPIPLKPKDGEIVLDLRPCLDRAYEDAGYANRIDYSVPPPLGLRNQDAEWAAELLKKPAKKRKG